jgi:mRNA-degrading endonuclease RelE of RelBE toxin-antitoxin system
MKFEIFLAPRAKKQYEKLDPHIRKEVKTLLSELEDDPYNKGASLKGINTELRYSKLFHRGVQYRAVYDIDKNGKEVLIVFLGSRENFYKELRRFIR